MCEDFSRNGASVAFPGEPDSGRHAVSRSAWPAIIVLALGASCFVTSELLPASLLSPIAEGLNVSEGVAGQAISVTAFFAVLGSLFASTFTGMLDRRLVVMICILMAVLGAVSVALAPNYYAMLTGRALFGLALGVFWATSASIILRLARPHHVPLALSLMFGAIPIAMTITVPVASALAALWGWRSAFFLIAGLGTMFLLLLAVVLPPLPAHRRANIVGVLRLPMREGIPVAMLALFLVFAGKFSLFAYVRPFLEGEFGHQSSAIVTMLFVFGVANLAGTSVSSFMIRHDLTTTLSLSSLVVSLSAIGLVLFSGSIWKIGMLIAFWGFSVGCIPPAWTTWMTRKLEDDAENAGCLQFSVMQLAIAAGVVSGGVGIEQFGRSGPYILGAIFLISAAILIRWKLSRPEMPVSRTMPQSHQTVCEARAEELG
ncbi:ribonucleoside transporter [Nitratireductor indicus C115]|uniref:Ribonucleoside transporter n=1 Tax=Nitratireductor indicus C115 TaxID=1231190 RepID=K2PTY9_9HYPH|nr:ribonucleoside transporter [Nitratireductor indicus C115]